MNILNKAKLLNKLSAILMVLMVLNPLIVPGAKLIAEELPVSYSQTEDISVDENQTNDVVSLDQVQEQTTLPLSYPDITSEVNPATYNITDTLLSNIVIDQENRVQTINKVELNKTYTYFFNTKVSIVFTQLPENAGNLVIKEIILTPEQMSAVNSTSNIAYDISSDMQNGTFRYNLTLPSNDIETPTIKYSEDINNIESAVSVNSKLVNNTVTIEGLDHFTLFYVTQTPVLDCPGAAYSSICYPTIQAAINAAALDAGAPHTINIAAGTYNEFLVINDNPNLYGLSIIGSGIGSTVINGNIRINGGVNTESYLIEKLTLRFVVGATPAYRKAGMYLFGAVNNMHVNKVSFENYDDYGIDFSNWAVAKNFYVSHSNFYNNRVAVKVGSTAQIYNDGATYPKGLYLNDNVIDGALRDRSYGIYSSGDNDAAGIFNSVYIYNNTFRNFENAGIYAEILNRAYISNNTFETSSDGIILNKMWKNGSAIDFVTINNNTFTGDANSQYFIRLIGRVNSYSGKGTTEGIKRVYFKVNTFDGAKKAAIYFSSNGDSVFKNNFQSGSGADNLAFYKNSFSNNLTDIYYGVPKFDLDAMTTLSWSGGNPETQTTLVEQRLVHDCATSPFEHGICDANDNPAYISDLSSNFGSIKYTESVFGTVIVDKYLIDQSGNSIDDPQTFDVHINQVNDKEVRIDALALTIDDTGVISDNGEDSLTATFNVVAGSYIVTEDTLEGYINNGCYIGESEVSEFTVTAGVTTHVTCYNEVEDLTPTVTITTAPGDSTTEQAITLTANISGGNLPTSILSWDSGNFAGCTGNASSVVTPSTPGNYFCTVTVTDVDGDTATATKSVVVNSNPPAADLIPTVVLFGNVPAANNAGTVQGTANTNFTIRANLNNLGDPNYNYSFGGICSGTTNNTPATFVDSNILNLAVGTYNCSVTVTDIDGDVATASVPVVITNNIGGAGSVAGVSTDNSNTNNDNTQTDEPKVEGVETQTCTEKMVTSGFVFLDTNTVNNKKDNSEEGIESVSLTIFVMNDKNEEVTIAKVTTNRIGYWETNLCAGSYFIRINTSDLPENTFVGGADTFEFNVLSSQNKSDVNFAVYSTTTNGFNWWLLLLLLLIILLAAGGYIAYNSRKSANNA